jgi:hypothetical protein
LGGSPAQACKRSKCAVHNTRSSAIREQEAKRLDTHSTTKKKKNSHSCSILLRETANHHSHLFLHIASFDVLAGVKAGSKFARYYKYVAISQSVLEVEVLPVGTHCACARGSQSKCDLLLLSYRRNMYRICTVVQHNYCVFPIF